MTTTTPEVVTYSTDEDVRNALGSLRDRLPSWVVLSTWRSMAHAEVLERLGTVYPTLPTFTGPALDVVRYAEAKLAAAGILDAIRVNLPDLGDAPDRLRSSAYAALEGGIVGYPAPVRPDPVAADTSGPRPRVSSFTALSAFPDPYEGARDVRTYE